MTRSRTCARLPELKFAKIAFGEPQCYVPHFARWEMMRLSACKDDIATPHSEKRVDRRGDRVIPLKDAWSGSAQVTEQQKCVQRPKTVSAFSSQSKGKTPRFCPDVGHFEHSRGGMVGFCPSIWA